MVGKLPPAQQLDDDRRDRILVPVASGLEELIFGDPGLFRDRPGFIAGPLPETGLAQAVQGLTRVNCRVWASRDKSGYSQSVNQQNADLCGPYLDTLNENPDPGFVGLEYKGGQCAGVSYQLNFTTELFFSDCTSITGNSVVGGFIGPLGQVTYSGSGSCPTAPGAEARIATGQGPVLLGGAGGGVKVTINSVTREDLAPDNCGNPPPVYQPPATVTPTSPIPPSITINIPGVGPIDVTIDLDPTGRPIICAPELETCVNIDYPSDDEPGGGDPGGGDPGGGGPPPGDIGEPGPGGTAGNGEDTEGEAPEGSILVGLLLTLTEIPEGARTYTGDIYRGPAYIYMGVPGKLDMDYAGSQLSQTQFVFAEKENLTAYRVRANDGYVIDVVPYYREVES